MRKRVMAIVVALALAVPLTLMRAPAVASPGDKYNGPYFGDGNMPPNCLPGVTTDPKHLCHRMRTGLNALDSPQVDVLVLVPVSPTAERDMRLMRQSIEMWEGGINYLAGEMRMPWLADGVDFHITVDAIDLSGGGNGGEFTTYPVVDPEIVVIATNPVGGIGIGIDPVDFTFFNEDMVPCHAVANPFDFGYWENLPGFDSHHDSRTGTYREDCDGAGGNICFAINGAIDPANEVVDFFGIFDLVSHEVGHCLTLGHVGDGGEGSWTSVAANDIMAYSPDPARRTKCVSTLDVEAFALRMSRYLDVNGDGQVTGHDHLVANDAVGDEFNSFQVQHPEDHLYASATGDPMGCPQPDSGVVPGPRTDWTPAPVKTSEPVLTVAAPRDGETTSNGTVRVTGSVEHRPLAGSPPSTGSFDDEDTDASTSRTEITSVDVEVTATDVMARLSIVDVPDPSRPSGVGYSLIVDSRKFETRSRGAGVATWDTGTGAALPPETAAWDAAANTVTFRLPREYLASVHIHSPYAVAGEASNDAAFILIPGTVVDDEAPEGDETIDVAGAPFTADPRYPGVQDGRTVMFQHRDGNSFGPQDTTLGAPRGSAHEFEFEVQTKSDVRFTLTWTDNPTMSDEIVYSNDLDLFVTGDGVDSGSEGATADPSETVLVHGVQGTLQVTVDPFHIAERAGTVYQLIAEVLRDLDGDGVRDDLDSCPNEPGTGADGCPIRPTEFVHVYRNGELLASQAVDTVQSADSFDITVQLAPGRHTLDVVWTNRDRVIRKHTVTVNAGGGRR